MRGVLVLVVVAACAREARPPVTAACGAGWAPLTERAAIAGGGVLAIRPDPASVIRSVRVDGVGTDLAATLAAVLRTRPGQTFGDAPLADDLRRLWALGVLDEAEIEAQGGDLAFVVTPRPRVAAVEVHAADREAVRRFELLPGAPFEPQRIARIASALEEGLVREGRLDAAVIVGRTLRADGIGVCVAVDPGPKVTVASVTFPGRRAIPEAVLRGVVHGAKKGGIYDSQLLEIDELRVAAEYWDRGYANVKVGSHRVVRRGKRLVVELPVTEGDLFRIGRVTTPYARGVTLPVKPGDVFSRSKIADAREQLATKLGAVVYPMTAVDLDRRTIDITFKPEWRWPWDAFKRWPSLLH